MPYFGPTELFDKFMLGILRCCGVQRETWTESEEDQKILGYIFIFSKN